MPDDLYGAVLIQARRRRALIERPDLGSLLGAVAAVRAQQPVPAAPPPVVPRERPDTLDPLPGARYRRSTPEQMAAFFGRPPAAIPKRR
jgi:hypothetical protein